MVFDKIGRRKALAVARVNGACRMRLENGMIKELALVLGSVEEHPRRMSEVEEFLTGAPFTEAKCRKAGELAANSVLQRTGHRHSSDYKVPVISRFVKALLEQTAQEGDWNDGTC